jgi:hypothetical protein
MICDWIFRMTLGLRREWEVLGNEWNVGGARGVALSVERQSGEALLLSVLVTFMGVFHGV